MYWTRQISTAKSSTKEADSGLKKTWLSKNRIRNISLRVVKRVVLTESVHDKETSDVYESDFVFVVMRL